MFTALARTSAFSRTSSSKILLNLPGTTRWQHNGFSRLPETPHKPVHHLDLGAHWWDHRHRGCGNHRTERWGQCVQCDFRGWNRLWHSVLEHVKRPELWRRLKCADSWRSPVWRLRVNVLPQEL